MPREKTIINPAVHAPANGINGVLYGIVYIVPEPFIDKEIPQIIRKPAEINHRLLPEGRRYMLIGFGCFKTFCFAIYNAGPIHIAWNILPAREEMGRAAQAGPSRK